MLFMCRFGKKSRTARRDPMSLQFSNDTHPYLCTHSYFTISHRVNTCKIASPEISEAVNVNCGLNFERPPVECVRSTDFYVRRRQKLPECVRFFRSDVSHFCFRHNLRMDVKAKTAPYNLPSLFCASRSKFVRSCGTSIVMNVKLKCVLLSLT